uniref:V-SNARE coiled-coil homology domain-containing protein n=1 Tax=Accipiter nisus TaxID=211598 RepID=A0A8B9MFD9_9AVES
MCSIAGYNFCETSGKAKHLALPGAELPCSISFLGSAPAPTQGPTSAGAAGLPPGTNVSSNKRLQQTQARVDEVVDIMRMNVDKVLERDQKLSELDNRADALQAGASQFETSAAKLKRKYWWKNCKMISAHIKGTVSSLST